MTLTLSYGGDVSPGAGPTMMNDVLVGRVDRLVTNFCRARWGGRLDKVAIAGSHLGRGRLVWIAAGALLKLHPREDREGTRRVALPVAVAYASSLAAARAIQRGRPCDRGSALIECPDGPSLPSDQTAGAFAGASAIGQRYPALRTPAYAAACVVAGSRVYCGVHHLSDVIAGAVAGELLARKLA
jgi:undecaprenyl-diphosphatase